MAVASSSSCTDSDSVPTTTSKPTVGRPRLDTVAPSQKENTGGSLFVEDDCGVWHLVGFNHPAKRQRLGITLGQVRSKSGERLRGDTNAATSQVVEKDGSSKTLEKLKKDSRELKQKNKEVEAEQVRRPEEYGFRRKRRRNILRSWRIHRVRTSYLRYEKLPWQPKHRKRTIPQVLGPAECTPFAPSNKSRC
jgi:hypothetical protein